MNKQFSLLFSPQNRLQTITVLIMTLYNIQSWIPRFKIVVDSSMALLTFYAFFCITKHFNKEKGLVVSAYRVVLMFMLLNVAYYIYARYDHHNSFIIAILGGRRIKDTLVCLIPFFIAYEIGDRGTLKPVFFLACMVPAYILSFWGVEIQQTDVFGVRVQNNVIYGILALFPYFILVKHIIGKILGFLLISFMVLYAAKRGAVLAIPGIFILFFLDLLINAKKTFSHFLIVAGLLFAIIWLSFHDVADFVRNDALIQRRVKATLNESSGRHYSYYYNLWRTASPKEQIIGLGYIATAQYSPDGEYAHNDFLEVLVDFGLIGVAAFVTLYFSLYLLCTNRLLLKDERLMLFSCLWIFFIKGLTAGGFFGDSWLLFFGFGYFVGKIHSRSLENDPENSAPETQTPATLPQQEIPANTCCELD